VILESDAHKENTTSHVKTHNVEGKQVHAMHLMLNKEVEQELSSGKKIKQNTLFIENRMPKGENIQYIPQTIWV